MNEPIGVRLKPLAVLDSLTGNVGCQRRGTAAIGGQSGEVNFRFWRFALFQMLPCLTARSSPPPKPVLVAAPGVNLRTLKQKNTKEQFE